MGIVEKSNNLHLNVSCGKLVNKKKEISVMAYEGLLLGIERKDDEYEGKIIGKITCKFKDSKSDEIAYITWSEESWYSLGFFPRITKIDLSKPFIIGVSASEMNEKMSFCWIKQGGAVKADQSEFPKPQKVTVGKKEIVDWTIPLEAMEKITKRINESLRNVDRGAFDTPTPKVEIPSGDLPF